MTNERKADSPVINDFIDMDGDPFSHRAYGPVGWTDPIVPLIEPYAEADSGDPDYSRFSGLPHSVLVKVAKMISGSPKLLMPVDEYFWETGIGEAIKLGATFPIRKATYEGAAVGPGRGDERIHVRALHVNVGNLGGDYLRFLNLAAGEGPTCDMCLQTQHYKRGFRIERLVGIDRRCLCEV